MTHPLTSTLWRFCLFALLLVPSWPVPDSTALARPAPKTLTDTLDADDRVEIFEEVWSTIDEKYYDPSFNGVNWRAVRERYLPRISLAKNDEDFYELLARMVGELRDAHTRFHSPREREERKKSVAVTSGLFVFEVEGRPAVVTVESGSEAARAGVKPGMIVTSVDGTPVGERLAKLRERVAGSSSERAALLRLYRRLLDGAPGSLLRLGLLTAERRKLEVAVKRRIVSEAPKVTSRILPSGYGYVRLNVWKSPGHSQFRKAMEALANTPGLIIDLRGNPGGEVDEVLRIARSFLEDRTPFGRFITRSGRSVWLYAEPDDAPYRGQVAILTNEASGSGSEMFAAVMQETSRAVVIGRRSCGCLLGVTKYRKLKGGGELSISELGYVSSRGRKLEGDGVEPERVVPLTLEDLRQGRDAALEDAEKLLQKSRRDARK